MLLFVVLLLCICVALPFSIVGWLSSFSISYKARTTHPNILSYSAILIIFIED